MDILLPEIFVYLISHSPQYATLNVIKNVFDLMNWHMFVMVWLSIRYRHDIEAFYFRMCSYAF